MLVFWLDYLQSFFRIGYGGDDDGMGTTAAVVRNR